MIDYPNCGENNPVFEQDEPVAVVNGVYGGRFTYAPIKASVILPVGMALYTRPQPRTWVELTNDDWNSTPYDTEFRAGAEWAEAKLKERNHDR